MLFASYLVVDTDRGACPLLLREIRAMVRLPVQGLLISTQTGHDGQSEINANLTDQAQREKGVIGFGFDRRLTHTVQTYTFPIHFLFSHTALRDVRLRRSNSLFAALPRRPFLRCFQASLALMATN